MTSRTLSTLLFLLGSLLAGSAAARPGHIEVPPLPGPAHVNDGLPLSDQAYAPDGSEMYFQTWNAYLQSRAGHHVFANFVISNIGIGDNTCGLNIAITTPDGRTLLETFQLSGDHLEGDTHRLYVRCDGAVISGDAQQMRLRGRTDKLGLDVRITQGPPGAGVGTLWLDEAHESFGRYNVPHLGSRLSGRIRYDGRWHQVQGTAAVEHLVTNTGLHRFSRIWHRIRVLDGDTALLLGGFEPTEDYERGVYFAFLARGGEVLHIAQGLKVRTTRRTAHAESGYGVPASVELELDDGRLRLQGRVGSRVHISAETPGHHAFAGIVDVDVEFVVAGTRYFGRAVGEDEIAGGGVHVQPEGSRAAGRHVFIRRDATDDLAGIPEQLRFSLNELVLSRCVAELTGQDEQELWRGRADKQVESDGILNDPVR